MKPMHEHQLDAKLLKSLAVSVWEANTQDGPPNTPAHTEPNEGLAALVDIMDDIGEVLVKRNIPANSLMPNLFVFAFMLGLYYNTFTVEPNRLEVN